jgi:hypothetical protein
MEKWNKTYNSKPEEKVIGLKEEVFFHDFIVRHERKVESFGKLRILDFFCDLRVGKKFLDKGHHFHEVLDVAIHPYQKMRFDIDIDREQEPEITEDNVVDLITYLIEGLYIYLSAHGCKFQERDVLVTTASNRKKFSFHIILDRYIFHQSILRSLYEIACDGLPNEYKVWVDSSIYKKLQNFRMLFNSKAEDPSRFKILYCDSPVSTYETDIELDHRSSIYCECSRVDHVRDTCEIHNPFDYFLGSLLGDYANRCTRIELPELVKAAAAEKKFVGVNLSEVVIDKINESIQSKFPGIFEIRGEDGNRLAFNRLKSSLCSICNRIHDNAGIFAWEFKNILYWGCFRAKHYNIQKRSRILTLLVENNFTLKVLHKEEALTC